MAFGHRAQGLGRLLRGRLSPAPAGLLSRTRTFLPGGQLAIARPKDLPYRLLHAAARVTHGARRLHLRIAATWPWHHDLAAAFARLQTLPRPAT